MTKDTQIAIIRLAMVGLFAWFGFKQLADPGAWVIFLPQWTGYFPIPGEMLVSLNGWFEVCASMMLLLGVRTRIIMTILGVHLVGIAISIGGAIGVRDAALGLVGIAFAFAPADKYTLDSKFSTPENHSNPNAI